MRQKCLHFSLLCLLCCASALSLRSRRAAYDLPAGVEDQLGIKVKKTFKCEDNGYYADVDNDCKIFHICATPAGKKGHKMSIQQSSLACGVDQRFDQSKLVCVKESDAIPCKSSPDFFYLNERIGDANALFLGPSDIDKAKNARPDYRAKARAKAR